MSSFVRTLGRLEPPSDVLGGKEVIQLSVRSDFLAHGAKRGVVVGVETGGHTMLRDETSYAVDNACRRKIGCDIEKDSPASQATEEGDVHGDFCVVFDDSVGSSVVEADVQERALQLESFIWQDRQVIGGGQLGSISPALHTTMYQ